MFSSDTVLPEAFAVKMSALTFAAVSWQKGKKAKAAIAMPTSVSSKSPGKGRPKMEPATDNPFKTTTANRTMPPSMAQVRMIFLILKVNDEVSSAWGAGAFSALFEGLFKDRFPSCVEHS